MATSHLLNTRTATFTDMIGNGKLYQVPAYQRSYSWTEEQWEDLWNDIEAMERHPDDRHYMGALVVESRSEREFMIIDGQQRLTTLSVLALAVIQRLTTLGADDTERQANAERASLLRRQFIGDKNPASLLETSKLTLGEGNGGFYHDYLVQMRTPLNPRGLTKSNRLLWQCFQWFQARLGQRADPGEQLARLLDQVIGLQLMFILITVDDELNAYTVFETLNARGLELSTTDLLKNWLFSRVSLASDRAVLQRRWETIQATVREERFADFLRYHLQCTYSHIRKERMFKLVRDSVRDASAVFALMDALEPRAELFAALDDPQHGYWMDLPQVLPHVRELQVFRTKQVMPVLFAAWERLSHEDFARLLKLLMVVSFRHTVVGSRNANELEPVYHQAAKALLTRQAQTPAQVFQILRQVYVDDERFGADFAEWEVQTRGQRKTLVRYVLCRLEADASGRPIQFDTDPATIEHVLPENADQGWDESIPTDKQPGYVYRLGNLSLLEAAINRRIGNRSFTEKREAYRDSSYAMTQAIDQQAPEEWSIAAIERRQQKMSSRAVHLWRSDFAE